MYTVQYTLLPNLCCDRADRGLSCVTNLPSLSRVDTRTISGWDLVLSNYQSSKHRLWLNYQTEIMHTNVWEHFPPDNNQIVTFVGDWHSCMHQIGLQLNLWKYIFKGVSINSTETKLVFKIKQNKPQFSVPAVPSNLMFKSKDKALVILFPGWFNHQICSTNWPVGQLVLWVGMSVWCLMSVSSLPLQFNFNVSLSK